MNRITINEIEKAVEGQLIFGNRDQEVSNICTDSRKACKGDLFVPIVGDIHDAHKFIPQVIDNGCETLFISDEKYANGLESFNVILVDNTTKAIQELSRYYLNKLNLKKIAVTGSVGKTSTRDMVYYILREKYKTGKPIGNFNNDIGVPLTIFSFDETMEAAVLEVGMDHLGEIHRLVDIIRPDIGIITNVGISHIEHLGTRENILKAKMEITDYFGNQNTLVFNGDNDLLSKTTMKGTYQTIRVGTAREDEYIVNEIVDHGEKGIAYTLENQGKKYEINLDIPGAHNGLNSALAIAACRQFGLTIEEAICGLKKMELTGNRLTVIEAGGIKIIDDTYNAAPESMKSAIDTLMGTQGKRKIAILGDMSELGIKSLDYHREIGEFAGEKQVDLLIAVGEKAAQIAVGGGTTLDKEKIMYFTTKEKFFQGMKGLFKAGDVIVVKASRSMEMEEVVERIAKEQE